MFKKIIIAVDGTDAGLDASALARVLVEPGGVLVVGHVVVHDGAAGVADAGEDEAVAAARRAITDAGGPAGAGVLVHAAGVAAGLHQLADEQSADLLVVGSHQVGRGGHLWSADRTRATLRDAPCPVAIAPRGYAGGSQAISSVGVGYDERPEARAALELGRTLGRERGADVQALEVVPATNWRTPESGAGWKAVDAEIRLGELPGVTGWWSRARFMSTSADSPTRSICSSWAPTTTACSAGSCWATLARA